MPRERTEYLAFNRGLISQLALARVDLKRMALAAKTMVNWMPRALGSMMLRPGWQYLGTTASSTAAKFLPFIFSNDDTALIEFTNGAMRVWLDDTPITRVAVTTVVLNGGFDVNLNNWTDSDEVGGTSDWVVGGYMGLTGNGTAAAIRDQQVTVAAAYQNVEHALTIVVRRGPVTLRVGSTSGGDEYVSEMTLRTGVHSLAFTPTGNFYIRFFSRLERQVLVNSCNVEAAGAMSVASPYTASDLSYIRGGRESQSGDVIFVACRGYTQRRIERHDERSWSLVLYQTDDGPFRSENTGPITLTPSALVGNITLTASASFFRPTHAPSDDNGGALFRLTSSGQAVTQTITAENTFTNAIRVTGVDAARVFTVTIDEDAVGAATFTLQRSLDSATGSWTDVQQWTADVVTPYDDTLDNQIAWYRLGVKTGDYVNGTHTVTLNYPAGSIDGIARITEYTSPTVVSAEVLTDLGGTAATEVWAEGQWSDRRGWPTSVGFYEGRLDWAGKDGTQLSVSDAFESFDEETEGDSGPINRTIGSGPVDTINWVLPLQRLILGGQGAEFSCRSNSFDDPLTPSNFNIKPCSTQGSAPVEAVKIDTRGAYVQRGGTRVFELAFNPEIYDYQSVDLTQLCPEVGQPSIVRMAVQRQPDTRLHCIRSDGTAGVLLNDKVENVLCWLELDTREGDSVEDVVILPGQEGDAEDRVYYAVARSVNGSTVRYLEKWAKESECVGGVLNKQADSFVAYSQAASATIGGLDHLIGEDVVVWDNGKCLRTSGNASATFTVSAGGEITVTNAGASYEATNGVVGLTYTADWENARTGRNLIDNARIDHLGLVLADTHMRGLQFGRSFDDMDYLPLMKDEAQVAEDTIYSSYDQPPIPFPGAWATDPRVCLRAQAPRPATVLAAVAQGEFYA